MCSRAPNPSDQIYLDADIELLVALEAVADFVDIGDVVPNAIEMPALGETKQSLISTFNWGFEPVLGVDDDGSDEEGFTFGKKEVLIPPNLGGGTAN
jgi:hypothetical protein